MRPIGTIDHITALSSFSTTREKVLEHRFIAEVGSCLWARGIFDFSVSHSEVDNSGYDVIMEVGPVIRHIQLKAARANGKTSYVSIQNRLADKPSGCVVWLIHDAASLAIEKILWFGGAAGQPLPDLGGKFAKQAKPNMQGKKAEKSAHRELTKGKFDKITSWPALAEVLFGLTAIA